MKNSKSVYIYSSGNCTTMIPIEMIVKAEYYKHGDVAYYEDGSTSVISHPWHISIRLKDGKFEGLRFETEQETLIEYNKLLTKIEEYYTK